MTVNKRKAGRKNHVSGNGSPIQGTGEVSVALTMDKATQTVLSKFISTQEAADRLGVLRRHIVNLLKSGKLEGQRIGGTWIVYAPSLDGYLQTKDPRGRLPSRKTD